MPGVDLAVLRGFFGGVQVGQSLVVVNGNNILDQTILLDGVVMDRATFEYAKADSELTNIKSLTEVIDNVEFVCLDPSADSDGDGVNDGVDVFPNNPAEWLDTDGDGVGDNEDPFPDALIDARLYRVASSAGGLVLNGGGTTRFGGGAVLVSGGASVPVEVNLEEGDVDIVPLSGLQGESLDASNFGTVYYERIGGAFSPSVRTPSGVAALETFGNRGGIPLEMSASGWIGGRNTTLGMIWDGRSGDGLEIGQTKEFYAVAEAGGNLVLGGRSSGGSLALYEASTSAPGAGDLTIFDTVGSGWFFGVSPDGSLLGGGSLDSTTGGYRAVVIDESRSLSFLPPSDAPIPWNFVYDIGSLANQIAFVGSGTFGANSAGHAAVWLAGGGMQRFTEFVAAQFSLTPDSDSFTDFRPTRVASVEVSPGTWVFCGEGVNANTGFNEGWILVAHPDEAEPLPPIISLNGDSDVTVECGVDAYVELGATAEDQFGDAIEVTIGGDTVNPAVLGSYSVTYHAVDERGLAAEQQVRVVEVVDTLPPMARPRDRVIAVDATGSLEITPSDLDAGSSDACGTVSLTIDQSSFDCGDLGVQPVTLTATDAQGFQDSAVAMVTIVDDLAPQLELVGPNPQVIECGTPYVELGVTVVDNCLAGVGEVLVESSGVDTTTTGAYEVIYNVRDASGNAALAVTRRVQVVDTVTPQISCPASFEVKATSLAGAVVSFSVGAIDSCDPNPVLSCVPSSGTLFPVGTTTVVCNALDASGNASSCQFVVKVLSAEEMVEDVGEVVAELADVPKGTVRSLSSKLQNVDAKLESGNTDAAVAQLRAFAGQVKALAGKKIDAELAAELVQSVGDIIAALSKPGSASRLSISLNTREIRFRVIDPGTIELTWERGSLEVADELQGPWSSVEDVASPLVLSLDRLQRFYRLAETGVSR